jgi:hypothetical protein
MCGITQIQNMLFMQQRIKERFFSEFRKPLKPTCKYTPFYIPVTGFEVILG